LKKRLTLTLLGLIITLTTWCQVTVTGTVISSDDKSPIPGVSIVEKGTTNGTVTQADGRFSINVNDEKSILQFYFIGYVTHEEPVNGRDNINVTLKIDCIRDWFDVQKIGLYLNSGVINNPVGGKFEIAFPAYFGRGTLSSSISYQTDFDKNKFITGDLKLKHFIFNCDFDMDAAWYYRTFESGDFNSTANSLETNFNFNKFGLIVGLSHLDYNPTIDRRTFNGPVVGLRACINGPLRLVISGKAAIYKDKLEYFGEILRDSRYINLFVKYYKLDTFSEISLGIGTIFDYRFRKQKR
jgi:hypothetical protein